MCLRFISLNEKKRWEEKMKEKEKSIRLIAVHAVFISAGPGQ